MTLRTFLEWLQKYYPSMDSRDDIDRLREMPNLFRVEEAMERGMAQLDAYDGTATEEVAELKTWVDSCYKYIKDGTGVPGFEDKHPHDEVGPTPPPSNHQPILDTLPPHPAIPKFVQS